MPSAMAQERKPGPPKKPLAARRAAGNARPVLRPARSAGSRPGCGGPAGGSGSARRGTTGPRTAPRGRRGDPPPRCHGPAWPCARDPRRPVARRSHGKGQVCQAQDRGPPWLPGLCRVDRPSHAMHRPALSPPGHSPGNAPFRLPAGAQVRRARLAAHQALGTGGSPPGNLSAPHLIRWGVEAIGPPHPPPRAARGPPPPCGAGLEALPTRWGGLGGEAARSAARGHGPCRHHSEKPEKVGSGQSWKSLDNPGRCAATVHGLIARAGQDGGSPAGIRRPGGKRSRHDPRQTHPLWRNIARQRYRR